MSISLDRLVGTSTFPGVDTVGSFTDATDGAGFAFASGPGVHVNGGGTGECIDGIRDDSLASNTDGLRVEFDSDSLASNTDGLRVEFGSNSLASNTDGLRVEFVSDSASLA